MPRAARAWALAHRQKHGIFSGRVHWGREQLDGVTVSHIMSRHHGEAYLSAPLRDQVVDDGKDEAHCEDEQEQRRHRPHVQDPQPLALGRIPGSGCRGPIPPLGTKVRACHGGVVSLVCPLLGPLLADQSPNSARQGWREKKDLPTELCADSLTAPTTTFSKPPNPIHVSVDALCHATTAPASCNSHTPTTDGTRLLKTGKKVTFKLTSCTPPI